MEQKFDSEPMDLDITILEKVIFLKDLGCLLMLLI